MRRLIPTAWMPVCHMSRVIVHWTAGSWAPSEIDREHYHVILAGNGSPQRGDHTISDNVSARDGDYAAHTKGCNTGSIGISVAAMFNARQIAGRVEWGHYPVTSEQWDYLVLACADLCQTYEIQPGPKTLLMHCEVGPHLGIPQEGKWDISCLPFRLATGLSTPGEELRALVAKQLRT